MNKTFCPQYSTKRCADMTQLDCYDSSYLFSFNYGRWSGKDDPTRKGKRIKLPVGYYERLRTMDDMYASFCHDDGRLIGSCFFLKKVLENGQTCVWITQLVVDSSYRKKGIATRLLQSAWGFSDYFAWGLATANTLTIKTLENVTWRKVDPQIIQDNISSIESLCESLPYRTDGIDISHDHSFINTHFFIDREKHDATDMYYVEKLGEVPEGNEWLAFTFHTQEMHLDEKHFNDFIEFSAEQLNDAYSRMEMDSQTWTKGTKSEIDYVESVLNIQKGDAVLDVGCGRGRHSAELARRGYSVVGIDASASHIEKAVEQCQDVEVDFRVWDARKMLRGKAFDALICLYDVIGSYRTLQDNKLIVHNISRKLRKGGRAVLSVMNMSYMLKRAKHKGDVRKNPRLLLQLPASNSMQASGDMFNPEYQLLDEAAHVVYHKEQFECDGKLSAEYVVADYRFTQQELKQVLEEEGLRVVESRFVKSGHFDSSFGEFDDDAKEILFLVEKL